MMSSSSNKQEGPKLFSSRILSRDRSNVTNASFRVYYSLGAGTVPFLWESKPGTPKSSVTPASAAAARTVPPISPPPSYQQSVSQSKVKKLRKSSRLESAFPSGDALSVDASGRSLGAIDLSTQLPAPALGAPPFVVAFADVVGVIFLKTTGRLYTFDLKTGQSILKVDYHAELIDFQHEMMPLIYVKLYSYDLAKYYEIKMLIFIICQLENLLLDVAGNLNFRFQVKCFIRPSEGCLLLRMTTRLPFIKDLRSSVYLSILVFCWSKEANRQNSGSVDPNDSTEHHMIEEMEGQPAPMNALNLFQ
ncbi:unnamed protein product [Miscanthus lutarioriparius]|uniref:Uncharacterized protein n=1 Tax=Miscanthus lutarioriparius TaxID=422564 RepID=A0A811NKV1_9POAL|nr:unnamed protein product [Miscanthus lutarioriparius]